MTNAMASERPSQAEKMITKKELVEFTRTLGEMVLIEISDIRPDDPDAQVQRRKPLTVEEYNLEQVAFYCPEDSVVRFCAFLEQYEYSPAGSHTEAELFDGIAGHYHYFPTRDHYRNDKTIWMFRINLLKTSD